MSNVQQAENKSKGELIGELRGKSVTTTIKEISPFGVMISSNHIAQFTGKYNASHMETDNAFLSSDGTNRYDGKAIQNTMEGDLVVVTSRGNGKGHKPDNARVGRRGRLHDPVPEGRGSTPQRADRGYDELRNRRISGKDLRAEVDTFSIFQ